MAHILPKKVSSLSFDAEMELMLEKKSEADKIMDLRGVSCPWSILKAKSQLTIMEPGEVLEVRFTDPLMFADFPKVLNESGHQLLQIIDTAEYARIYVRRGNKEEHK